MNVDDFEKYVRLMAECFEDDPGIRAQLKGISNAEGMAFGFFTDESFIKQLSEAMNDSEETHEN